jgi:putative transposase
LFWALGNTPFAREEQYAELVRAGLGAGQRQALTDSALSGWVLGDADFVADLQKRTQRRLSKAQPGRPVKQ